MELRGRKALITGSTSGIGLGIARTLAASGSAVMLHGFGDPAAIAQTQRDLRSAFGVECGYDGTDIATAEGCRALVHNASRTLGGLDIVVNNAGIQRVHPVTEFPAKDWDSILAINLSAAFHIAAAALPPMRQAGWGRIINVASVHGLIASVNKAAYVSAKHGLVGLTRVIALETAQDGVTCNAICPGFVKTPLIDEQIAAQAAIHGSSLETAQRKLLAGKQPSLQFIRVEDIGAMAVFLCSDHAANITGTALPIDGGWTAQ